MAPLPSSTPAQRTYVQGHNVLSGDCVLLEGLAPALSAAKESHGPGVFIRAVAPESISRLRLAAGKIPNLRSYTVCYRYEPYWMKPAAGHKLSDVPEETQFFLAELTSGQWLLAVPLLDDDCRSFLRGTANDDLELVIETGDAHLGTTGGLCLYVAAGTEPFSLLAESACAVGERLGSGPLRRDKPVPAFVDTLGWCTWDAFYRDVSADGVISGLERLTEAGVKPRFLILDDGWQSYRKTSTGEERLTSFDANEKFGGDLAPLIERAKRDHGIETFLVWHAIVGYWGGVDGEALDYGVIDQPRRFGEGIVAHRPRFNEDWWGGLVGLVPADRIRSFYEGFHSRLLEQGVDGVKVDSQAVLEAIAARQGGRVRLTRAYRSALENSVNERFGGRLINCMANAQETYYGSPGSTLVRSSIDFFPITRAENHPLHLYANAHVGLWFGHFMLPDWDMFQSRHEWGAYHAAGRAVSGGPVYVSDKPGQHDVELLHKLVCRDGTVLRCNAPGLPTRDTLTVDPTRSPSLLKIWNRNGASGFVGAFHAHHDASGAAVTARGEVSPVDVPDLGEGPFAVYAHVAQTLSRVTASQSIPLELSERQFELFTFAPITEGFAAIGLADKFNSAGAIATRERDANGQCTLRLRDGGLFLAYWAERPTKACLDGESLPFLHDESAARLSIAVPHAGVLVFSWN